ncbi:hypothetical protein MAP00_008495 [Monascus purpureus]|nr:hypothetical protein MAP00_008495 [Monascus purpureus]
MFKYHKKKILKSDLLQTRQSTKKHNLVMSNPNFCGCRIVHPAPRDHPKCTKTPNNHLACYNFEPPVDDFVPCGQQNVTHNIEHVHPASSTKRYGNYPNHRNLGIWYAGGKRFETPKTGRGGQGKAGSANMLVQ